MNKWDNIRRLNDIHTCYWCPSEGHKFCTHPELCIFDEELMEIDKEIVELNKQLQYSGENIKVGGISVNPQKEIIKEKIRELKRKRRCKKHKKNKIV